MRLRTIGLISTLALAPLAGPLPAEAQQAVKVNRIGFLVQGGRRGCFHYLSFLVIQYPPYRMMTGIFLASLVQNPLNSKVLFRKYILTV